LLKRWALAFLFLPALFVLTAFADQAYGCSLRFMHTLPPDPNGVRITGVIAGYRPARPVGLLTPAPTLYVRIREVVSGTVQGDDAEVAPLAYGADCRSMPYERQALERIFPIGTTIVVFGVAGVGHAGTPVVVAETNRSQYVVRIPQGVTRTSDGDVDFQRSDGIGPFEDFEFDRVLLTVPKIPVAQRVSRLRNLTYFSGLRDPRTAGECYAPVPRVRNFAYYSSLRDRRTARECFAQLVSSSGVSKADAQALRDSFERLLQTPR